MAALPADSPSVPRCMRSPRPNPAIRGFSVLELDEELEKLIPLPTFEVCEVDVDEASADNRPMALAMEAALVSPVLLEVLSLTLVLWLVMPIETLVLRDFESPLVVLEAVVERAVASRAAMALELVLEIPVPIPM